MINVENGSRILPADEEPGGSRKVAAVLGAIGFSVLALTAYSHFSNTGGDPADLFSAQYGRCLDGTPYDVDKGATILETDKGTLSVSQSGAGFFAADALQFVVADNGGLHLKASDSVTSTVLAEHHCGSR